MRKILSKILLAAGILGSAGGFGQSPGGVSNPVVWLKADAGTNTTTSAASVSAWTNYGSSGGSAGQLSTLTLPTFQRGAHNFNPAIVDGVANANGALVLTNVFPSFAQRSLSTFVLQSQPDVTQTRSFVSFVNPSSWDVPYLGNLDASRFWFYWDGSYQAYVTLPNSLKRVNNTPSINGYYLPQWTTNPHTTTLSMNGAQATASGNSSAGTGVGQSLYISNDGGNNVASSGSISEIITFDKVLTDNEKQRVNSYLAVKYGISLLTAAGTALPDYLSSNSTVIWNATANASYNNGIAGIGFDAGSALSQKQSKSVNAGKQLLIGTTGLADDNQANATALTDGQYLLWGDNGLAKVPTVQLTGVAGLNYRFGAIWKAQNTGSVGTVRVTWPKGLTKLSLMQSSDETFDGSDAVTDMTGNTITVNGVVYNYADVTLSNGQFFTFAAFVQAPGGVVANLLMWHKANDGEATAGEKDIWKDLSPNGRDVIQTNNTTYRPKLVTDAAYAADSKNYFFNFNPFYYFDGSNDFFNRQNDDYFPTVTSAGSSYGVMFNSASGGWRTPYGWGDDDPNLNRAGDNYSVWRENGQVIDQNLGLTTRPAHIGGMAWKGGGAANNGIYLNMNGRIYGTTTYNIGNLNDASNFAIGSEGVGLTGNGNEVFQGGISEVFAYSADHQNSAGNEKQRINSYLALKYGITLSNDGGTGVPDYLSSTSAVIWNGAGNAAYGNNIAGIGVDYNSALDQRQSISENDGKQVVISTPGLANTNALNAQALNNGQFLLWGDNGLAKVPSAAVSGVAGFNYRFAAIWKVQNTGSVGTVRVAWPKGVNKLALIQSADETFDGSDVVTDMTANVVALNGVDYNYADVTLANGQFFTFVTQLNGPGGISLDLRVWLRSDAGFAPQEWTDMSGNANDYTQTNATRQPFLATAKYNFNPIVDFGTNGADARFMAVPSGKPYTANGTASTLFTAFLNRSVSGYADIVGFGATTTGTGLINANLPVFTTIGDNPVLYPQASAGSTLAINKLYLNDASFTIGSGGVKYGQNGVASTVASNVAAGNALFANGSILGSQPEERNGLIGEFIAYQRDLSEAEKQRVRSYVAIKYGLTLPHNYTAANGTTVFWDQATNTGFGNNIAGIVRDDEGSLNQKQSWSINTTKEVLISTTGLADDNAANATTLNNQQFLVWGDNGLAKAPAVYNPTINGSVNVLFKAIWKVQNTGSVGTVRVAWPAGLKNLSLIQSADQTFDGSDQLTPMSGNTQTINGVTYNYADVTLANGQYFTFASLREHAPGGVFAGLSHWYRADMDATNTGDGTDLTAWKDYTSGVVSAQISTAPIPKYKQGAFDYLNFNPGVNFTATNQVFGNITEQTLTSLNFNIFTATKEGMAGARYFNIGMDNTTFNGTNWDQPGLYADGGIARRTNTGAINALTNPGSVAFSGTQPNIAYFTFWDLGMSKGMNGAPRGAAYTHAAIGSVTGGHIFGSNGITTPPGGDDGGIIGNIGEVIVYGADTITTAERNRVDSYLAIKYGVTLNNGVNYVTSAGTTVWDKTQNSAYYNNVAGVGRDEISALHQKQSRSQASNANNQVIMALGTVAATNAANASNLADGQFLLWGDNGNTQAMTNSASTYTTFAYSGNTDNRRMNRVWKVQNTGVGQSLTLRFPVASVGTTTIAGEGSCAKYVLVFASDAAFTSNVSIANLTVNGTNYDAAHTFPAGASYFTYAKVSSTVDGQAYLPSTTESTVIYSNCTSGGWNYFLQTSNTANKVLALNGLTNTQLSKLTVTITPQGVNYVSGTRKTNLMPRQASVADADSATYSGVKVRVYYSPSELAATQLPGAVTNGWFKYEGTAGAVISDLQADGVFTYGKAVPLTPAASGVEDGVNYVEFHNITKFSSFVYVSSTELVETVLPVKLVQFKGEAVGDQVALSWTTSNEEGSKGFEIERSINTRDWANIGFVSSKGENGNGIRNYGFTDLNPSNGTNYYRLKQIDFNGDSEYSRTISVSVAAEKMGLVAYPNPAGKGELSFLLKHVSTPVASVRVYAVSGAEISGLQLQNNVLNVKNLASGMYLLKVTLESGDVLTTRFAVQ